MADVYASAVGTTVLQLKEIPPRPAEFDGALCLFGLKQGKDEAAIGVALKRFGEIKRIELDRDPAVVRFTTATGTDAKIFAAASSAAASE